MDITLTMQKAGLAAYEHIRCSPHLNTPDRVVQDVFNAMIAVAVPKRYYIFDEELGRPVEVMRDGSNAPEPAPPVDNDHVAEGAEKFPDPAPSLIEIAEDKLIGAAHATEAFVEHLIDPNTGDETPPAAGA